MCLGTYELICLLWCKAAVSCTSVPLRFDIDFITNILREKSLAIYFGDSQFGRNGIFNFIISKIYIDKRLPVGKINRLVFHIM